MDYKSLLNAKRTKELWYAELKTGEMFECGFGYVDGEFEADSFEKIAKAVNEDGGNEYQPIDGFYTFDGDIVVVNSNYKDSVWLKEIYTQKHPENECFVLVPKEDIVKTWFV